MDFQFFNQKIWPIPKMKWSKIMPWSISIHWNTSMILPNKMKCSRKCVKSYSKSYNSLHFCLTSLKEDPSKQILASGFFMVSWNSLNTNVTGRTMLQQQVQICWDHLSGLMFSEANEQLINTRCIHGTFSAVIAYLLYLGWTPLALNVWIDYYVLEKRFGELISL